ncbi:ChaN family lipoprotein [sulfur-oxidizing endosymbiont of Gigantopelta aegis]|uniref:ChaN family lipoprotein n=1 Tax=sulfur-oxidizing endosymbiont of Gigantopelta aegis TaxID=2794934 RepID=UPI0018DC67D7|nr:ChaN family lipoprotein [sulfur-oxidizing endosymbiont of Gigantopelta aegis]
MKKLLSLFIVISLVISLNACQSLSNDSFSPSFAITEHPLVDTIWSVSEQQFVTLDSLNYEARRSNVILLGETHDNIRHHQLQSHIIAAFVAQQQFPAIAYEMLNHNQQESIDQFHADYLKRLQQGGARSTERTLDAFAKKIQWEKSGWPEWSYYQPVFFQNFYNDLPIIAANLDAKTIREAIKQGPQVLSEDYQRQLERYQYPPELKKSLQAEILEAHCKLLPEKMLSPMLMGQQLRDLAMTKVIADYMAKQFAPQAFVPRTRDLVLIAGSGHTRTDYGIPYYLRHEAPNLKVLSMAFIEVSKDKLKPSDYAKNWSKTAQQLPFDYVWFTQQAEREDQCEKMQTYMKNKGN